MAKSIVPLIEQSIINNGTKPALSDYKGQEFSYAEVFLEIQKLHLYFRKLDIKQGDHITLLGKNSARWTIGYLAILTYGSAVVPILPDFPASDAEYIIDHSDSKILLIDDSIFKSLNIEKTPEIRAVFSLQNKELLFQSDKNLNLNDGIDIPFEANTPHFPVISGDDLAVISYTSGTTGFSKGVMLPHKSLFANISYAQHHMPLEAGDKIVSFLPLAHAYGCAFEFLFPFTLGCHITLLTKTPTPQIITEAFNQIKPRLILSVPLVMEKIYRKRIVPVIQKPLIQFLIRIPLLNQLIFTKIRKGLSEAFGNNFHEVVIGGAALNGEIEAFLKKIKFPFTIGYGMTECGPLISYAGWKFNKLYAAGQLVDSLEIKVDSKDPYIIPGEFMLKGDNVMTGYYKNKEATDAIISKDGWLRTGDLGTIDHDQFIFIKGRSKNMILGPSGKNIYPEEIEARINNLPYIMESVVIGKENQIVGLVYPDPDQVKKENLSKDDLVQLMNENLKELNQSIPKYMQVNKLVIWEEEFEKTPKKSIKRFLYNQVNI